MTRPFFPLVNAMPFQTRPSLIARLRNTSDAAAWNEFVACYDPFICRVGAASGVPRHAIADIVQEVLLTVVRTIPQFHYNPARGRFRAWLARVVRSRSIDWSRRASREIDSRNNQDRSRSTNDSVLEEGESTYTDALRDGLAAVRGHSRPLTWNCFERHVLQGQAAAQVAEELGLSENAVYLNSMRLMRRVELESRRSLERSLGHGREPLSGRT